MVNLKKAAVLAGLVLGVHSFQANAQLVKCDIDTKVNSIDFGIELGGGNGEATCWDVAGNEYSAPLDVALDVGVGLQIGLCDVTAHYEAQGVGFALDSLLSAMAQIELAPGKNGGSFGVDLNPLGINAMLTVSKIQVKNCAKFLDVKGEVVTQAGPLQPAQ